MSTNSITQLTQKLAEEKLITRRLRARILQLSKETDQFPEVAENPVEIQLTPTRKVILAYLQNAESLTRPDLVFLTGLSRTTVFDNLQVLSNAGLIQCFNLPVPVPKRGRPVIAWELVKT